MKKRWFIAHCKTIIGVVADKEGSIIILDHTYQPIEGFESFEIAEEHLLDLIKRKEGILFERTHQNFTILPIWESIGIP